MQTTPKGLLSLSFIKNYLRLDPQDTREDELLLKLRTIAVSAAEQYLQISICAKEITELRDDCRGEHIFLKHHPIQKITQITLKRSTQEISIAENLYKVNLQKGLVNFFFTLNADQLSFSYLTGYPQLEDLPELIQMGILHHLCALYEDRHASALPQSSKSFYAHHKQLNLY